jgi:hypothetical protein
MNGVFGTKETTQPFPLEYCSSNVISHEIKHLLPPLVFTFLRWKPEAPMPLTQGLMGNMPLQFMKLDICHRSSTKRQN